MTTDYERLDYQDCVIEQRVTQQGNLRLKVYNGGVFVTPIMIQLSPIELNHLLESLEVSLRLMIKEQSK
jgi:hypothetical protein